MTTMLQKMADDMDVAFCREGGDRPNDLDWKAVARAALLAIREAQLPAGNGDAEVVEMVQAASDRIWRDRIDAILGEAKA